MSSVGRNGGDGDLGCQGFGHLVSPFVDDELPAEERRRFEAHLDGCEPCRRLADDYRLIDVAARPDFPEVAAGEWDRAWKGIQTAVDQQREDAESAPMASITRLAERFTPPRLLRPVLYLAAAALLVMGLRVVQQAASGDPSDPGVPPIVEQLEDVEVTRVACTAPGYTPVHYRLGEGADGVTVIQCAWTGVDT